MKNEWPPASRSNEQNEEAKKIIENSLENKKAVFDDGQWEKIAAFIREKYPHIIALRGAGTNNGIDKKSADELLEKELVPRIKQNIETGPVAIMFDGDQDSLAKPDIGYIMGRLRDEFKDMNSDQLLFAAAQKKSWYYPSAPEGNLGNANNQEYFTYVFEDGKYPGEHNSFTQSKELVDGEGYEQWYIGASGDIANEQLSDYNNKISEGGKRKAIVFKAPINQELTPAFEQKLNDAKKDGDQAKIEKFEKVLEQRQSPYGVHWNSDGTPKVDPESYRNLDLEFVS
jgi:hypothetical protein